MTGNTRRAASRALASLAFLAIAAGCGSTMDARRSSSILHFLADGPTPTRDSARVPTLRLPLRVGIVFVPDAADDVAHRYRLGTDAVLSQEDKQQLMQRVAERFRDKPYVRDIELIPTDYLTPRGGFSNLDQLRQMFGVDVVALVSYDQVQFTDERKRSVLYLTIAGAYLVEGERNDTRTMLDAAVFDVGSRRLLFRAPGQSRIQGSASAADASLRLRQDAREGLRRASDDLAVNLDSAIVRFSARLREPQNDIRVIRPDGAR